MGVLVGILIGLGAPLPPTAKFTAMRASGIGVWRFARMLSLFVVVAWTLALLNSLWIAPACQSAMARLQDRLKTAQASFEVQAARILRGIPQSCPVCARRRKRAANGGLERCVPGRP